MPEGKVSPASNGGAVLIPRAIVTAPARKRRMTKARQGEVLDPLNG